MDLTTAQKLISPAIVKASQAPVQWADLGAGNGLFSNALSSLLPAKSTIIAIDKNADILALIKVNNAVELKTIAADFNLLPKLPRLDGIIIANALHYVRDQTAFLSNIRTNYLKASGILIVIEYDLENSNAWVPYPITIKKLEHLAQVCGFVKFEMLGSVASRLNSSEIYSACLKP